MLKRILPLLCLAVSLSTVALPVHSEPAPTAVSSPELALETRTGDGYSVDVPKAWKPLDVTKWSQPKWPAVAGFGLEDLKQPHAGGLWVLRLPAASTHPARVMADIMKQALENNDPGQGISNIVWDNGQMSGITVIDKDSPVDGSLYHFFFRLGAKPEDLWMVWIFDIGHALGDTLPKQIGRSFHVKQ